MLSNGLNKIGRIKLAQILSKIKGKVSNDEIKKISHILNCKIQVVRNHISKDKQVPEEKPVSDTLAEANKVLASELKIANKKIADLQNSKQAFTGKQVWDVYAKAVGGKTFDDKPLPEFDKLGAQQKGWVEVAKYVSS